MRSVLLRATAACAALLCAAPVVVQAQLQWGALGHYMVAAVAQGFLSPSATQGIANLLPESNGDMSQVASWADSVARNMYPWSPPLHYVNTPDWTCNYDRKRDCSANGVQGFCVDGAIQNFTGQLIAGKAPISLNVALKFVIHFIGDIHQPLHCGFNSDEGGNTIIGTFEQTKGRKLHQVWDNDMVDKRIKEDFSGVNSTYLQYFMNRIQTGDWSSQVSQWRSCPASDSAPASACSQTWAQESVQFACSTAYVDQNGDKIQNGFNLADEYYAFALPVAELQIAKGGVRLANVVNAVFNSPAMRHYTLPREEFLRLREAQLIALE